MFLFICIAFVAELTPIMRSKKSRRLCDGIEMIIEVEQINHKDAIFWSSVVDVLKTLLLAVRELCTAIPYLGAKSRANSFTSSISKVLLPLLYFSTLIPARAHNSLANSPCRSVCDFLLPTMHRYS